jgi:hypothetical protein
MLNNILMSGIGYRIEVYSEIRYNDGLCDLHSDIGGSDIRLSPISLFRDIRLRDHLCLSHCIAGGGGGV